MIIKWNNEELTAQFGTYPSTGNVAITLWDQEHSPYAKASVNPEEKLTEGEVAIKNWTENKGVLEALIDAGIVEQPHRYIQSGFVSIPVCKLIVKED